VTSTGDPTDATGRTAQPGTLERMSHLFVRTLREDPADAEVPSHRLLVRGGYVRRVASGLWSWLPLGMAVLHKVERVVREEMAAIGAQEVHFPALLPREPYEVSGRWSDYGAELFRLTDRRDAQLLLGPTHEEFFTLLVKDIYTSWKDLPAILFQIQAKYRDEPRPRSGILRSREFLMKDSYSFDLDAAGLQAAYDAHRAAYQRIFTRLGLDYRIVRAHSGAMGGSASEEFLAPAAVGEDTFVYADGGDYAANVEAADRRVDTPVDPTVGPAELVATPGAATIESVCALLGVDPRTSLKSMVYAVDGAPVVVLVRGDREVLADRLADALAPAVVELADEGVFALHPALVKGYIGPQGLQEQGIRVFADVDVVPGSAWVVGGNAVDTHLVRAVAGRDFTVDDTVDCATVVGGDLDPLDGLPLRVGRGIELGHIFQLGQKYAAALGLEVAGPDGRPVTVTMGSYGVGVSRAVAAVVEQNHDDRGISWPRGLAPYDVHVLAVGKAGQVEAAEALCAELCAHGFDVLLDDRGLSAGVAFKDAELIGMPTVLVVGKGLAAGLVEVKDRRTGEREDVGLDAAAVARLLRQR